MALEYSFNIDFLVIARCFAALCWGISLAVFLQYSKLGRFIANERTWLSVVLGIGVDLLIAWNAPWLLTCAVIAFSSVGIVYRSIYNERYEPNPRSYKVKHWMEDAIDATGDAIRLLETALDDGRAGSVSKALSRIHAAQRALMLARYGEPEK